MVLELAAACVRFVAAMAKIQLDFTPETLPILDHYVRESRGAVKERPESLGVTARAVGAYLGEVIRRHHNGQWIEHESSPAVRTARIGSLAQGCLRVNRYRGLETLLGASAVEPMRTQASRRIASKWCGGG